MQNYFQMHIRARELSNMFFREGSLTYSRSLHIFEEYLESMGYSITFREDLSIAGKKRVNDSVPAKKKSVAFIVDYDKPSLTVDSSLTTQERKFLYGYIIAGVSMEKEGCEQVGSSFFLHLNETCFQQLLGTYICIPHSKILEFLVHEKTYEDMSYKFNVPLNVVHMRTKTARNRIEGRSGNKLTNKN